MPKIELPLPRNRSFMVAGDWHGTTSQAKYAIEEAANSGVDTIIHVGDFGLFPSEIHKFLAKTNRIARDHGITIYTLDGNHEDHAWLASLPIDATTGLKAIPAPNPLTNLSNIFVLPRNTRWRWDDTTFLALGGAASIDRRFRTQDIDWWAEETLSPEDIDTAIAEGFADVMFTHDSPSTAPNPVTDNLKGQMMAARHYGMSALEYATDHRTLLSQVTNAVAPRLLFHGHYHVPYQNVFRHQNSHKTSCALWSLDEGANPKANTVIFTVDKVKEIITELDKREY